MMVKFHRLLCAGTLCIGMTASLSALAADDNSHLTGDWNGTRRALSDAGVDLSLGYLSESATNISGGDHNEGAYADEFELGLGLDLDKLLSWSGASVRVLVTDRNGNNLNDKADLGALMQFQEIYGRGSVTRWTMLYLEQKLLDDKLDIKLGRLPMNIDIANYGCDFINLSFCGGLPGYLVSTWYNYPVSQWGGRIRYDFDSGWYAMVSATQVNPRYLENGQSMNVGSPSGTIGGLYVAEFGSSMRLGASNLPGSFFVGLWRDTADSSDQLLDVNGEPQALTGEPAKQHDGNSGLYFNIQQQITSVDGSPKRGMSLFVNFVQADSATSYVDQLLSIGMRYAGPFAARPDDALGFVVGRTRVSSSAAAAQHIAGGEAPGSEYPSELYYRAKVLPWLNLEPSLQYIYKPGGVSSNDNLLIGTLRVAVDF
ncbi:carbohydrate porin [Solimonas marina]|uniref:Carbohydrate porin n=1 Tax=Solimonas marina TaxID=2714601 RepID=A0A970B6V8_9GAMM|nr:carbohydrate porin [Solimonas marina]NKF23228.1 carbohydrate porin [Solimonas marina]